MQVEHLSNLSNDEEGLTLSNYVCGRISLLRVNFLYDGE